MKLLHVLAAVVFLGCMLAVFDGIRNWVVPGIAAISFLVAVGALLAAHRAASTTPVGGEPSATFPHVATSPTVPSSKENIMTAKRIALPLDVVRHVLWHFGDSVLGVQPGRFVSRLLVLAAAADPGNLEKLRAEWPEYITALDAARHPWGLDWLRGIAKAELDHAERGLDFTAVAS